MWSSVANLKGSLSKIALDVHDDDDEELSIYTSPPRDQSVNGDSVSERRNSRSFTGPNTSSPIMNGFDSSPNHEAVESESQELELDPSSLGTVNTMFAAIFRDLARKEPKWMKNDGKTKSWSARQGDRPVIDGTADLMTWSDWSVTYGLTAPDDITDRPITTRPADPADVAEADRYISDRPISGG